MTDNKETAADPAAGNQQGMRPQASPEELARFARGVLGGGRPVVTAQLAEMAQFLEERVRVEPGVISDPLDGTEAPIYLDATGVHAIPPSLFDPHRTRPVRRQGIAELTTLDSFIEYVNRFKAGSAGPDGATGDYATVIFAKDDRRDPKLVAVFDHHAPTADVTDAAFARHRALHKFPLSDEWKAWNEKNGIKMGMTDFASFIEDRIVDVLYPDAVSLTDHQQRFLRATNGSLASPDLLLKVSTSLKINESNHVVEARNLSSGDGEIKFASETSTEVAGDLVTIPGNFAVALPVFNGSETADVLLARLRYRREGGSVKLWYDLWRPDRVFDHAFNEALDKTMALTAVPLFRGQDEGAARQ